MKPDVRLLSVCALVATVAVAVFTMRPKGEDRPATRPTPDTVASDPDAAKIPAAQSSAGAPATAGAGADRGMQAAEESGSPGSSRLDPHPSLTLLGSVQAASQATLSARAPSFVRAVTVRDGDAVHRGQLLVQLDDIDMVSQLSSARAALSAAAAQLAKAEAGRRAQKVKADADVQTAQAAVRQAQIRLQGAKLGREAAGSETGADLTTAREAVRKARVALDRAKANLKSARELQAVGGISRSDLEGAESQVVVTQSDLDTAREQERRAAAGPAEAQGAPPSFRVAQSESDVAAAQAGVVQAVDALRSALEARTQALSVAEDDVAAARAGVAQARAAMEGAEAGPQQDRLISPIGGVATVVNAHRGEVAQPGAPLVTIVALDRPRVEALVPARELTGLREGRRATVLVDSLPGRPLEAVISFISRVAEPDGRTFRVKFRLLHANAALHPGQSARITILPAE